MAAVEEILIAEGFSRIGKIRHDLEIGIWWHHIAAIQVLVLELGSGEGEVLIKGSKGYYLLSMAEEAETWARDIAPFHDYLEAHFREVDLAFSFHRDVPQFLAEKQARKHRHQRSPKSFPPSLASLRERLAQIQRASRTLAQFSRLSSPADTELLHSHLAHRQRQQETESRELVEQITAVEQSETDEQHLIQEYRRKGSAASLTFSISSNLHVVATDDEFRVGVRSIVKELCDLDRFQVRQVLNGGRLRLQIAEVKEPAIAWIEQWFGGMLNPNQLERVLSAQSEIAHSATKHVIVTPDEDIERGGEGEVINHRKLLAARVILTQLSRLGHTGREVDEGLERSDARSLHVGRIENGTDREAIELLLDGLGHVYLSGKTGSGKSVALRVLVEEVSEHEGVGVLVLDPRNQFFGLRLPQDRPELLKRFRAFGMENPKRYAFEYFAPHLTGAHPLPANLGALAQMRSVLSFKQMDDVERCRLFREVLDAVFDQCAREEAPSVRLVIAIEEAHLFTRRLVVEEARDEALRCEQALDRILREGRKYGICTILASQSIKDFGRDAAAIRQNTTTRIFLNNSDREIEYAKDYLENARDLISLRPGAAFICNPQIGVLKVAFRPSYSKVWDFSDRETQFLLGRPSHAAPQQVSESAQKLLEVLRRLVSQERVHPNLSRLAEAAGITSKRLLGDLVKELERSGCIRVRSIAGPGQPRVVEMVECRRVSSAGAGRMADETGHNGQGGTHGPC